MAKEVGEIWRSLLTLEEYNSLIDRYQPNNGNTQINYYFDTPYFILNAFNITIRIKKKENSNYELALRRKKNYNLIEVDDELTEEQFQEMLETGRIPIDKIQAEIQDVVKNQKLVMYMSLETYRQSLKTDYGRICIDKCKYFDIVDYEIEYHANDSEKGKDEFVNFIKGNNFSYKKCNAKLDRAKAALKEIL